jgi:hypothetical protein
VVIGSFNDEDWLAFGGESRTVIRWRDATVLNKALLDQLFIAETTSDERCAGSHA